MVSVDGSCFENRTRYFRIWSRIASLDTTTFCTMTVMTVMTTKMMTVIMTNKNAAAMSVQFSSVLSCDIILKELHT
jgi:hypothetical protein